MRIGKGMTTYTGLTFYPLDPQIEDVSTRDIAHSLALLCRANGHYRHFYSVGQHCLNCANEAKLRGYSKRIQLGCLLHDASEAYISDITRPVKHALDEYLEIENSLQRFLYAVYGLSDLTEEEHVLIADIDDEMLEEEKGRLLKSHEESKGQLIGQHDFQLMEMAVVAEEFEMLVDKLQNSIG